MKLSIAGVLVFLFIFLHVDHSAGYKRTRRDVENATNTRYFPPELFMTAEELVKYYQYPVESHSVQTEDGYLLTMHRIPHGKEETNGSDRPVVLLQHGILYSSVAWVMKPKEGLAFVLADAGYDVWLGNFRGNTYSKGHVKMSTSSLEYWNFSWHEMAQYDLPAMIDYVREETGRKKLLYVGHSTGANVFYIMCALRPEYNSKIEAQFSLAPNSIMDRTTTLIRKVGRLLQTIIGTLLSIGQNFTPNAKEKQSLSGSMCIGKDTPLICKIILYVMGGPQLNDIDKQTIAMIMAHFPAGTSTKTIIHYAQNVHTGEYADISYSVLNYIIYSKRKPEKYDLTLVKAPVYLHYAPNDVISTEKEIRMLDDLFPNSQGMFKVRSEQFYHLDFIWGKNATDLLYPQLLKQMSFHKDG